MRAAGGQDPLLLRIQPLRTAKALMYEGAEGSRAHALDIASGHPPETKKDPEIEYGRRKMSGNKTETLEELRTMRKRTSRPILKLQKCDMWGHHKFQ